MAPSLAKDKQEWPNIDPVTVAPLVDGRPDLFNHQPTRFITKAEAEYRRWKHFWTGETCNYGHRAARYVANPYTCTDCVRLKHGKLPIYTNGVPEFDTEKSRRPGPGRPPGTPQRKTPAAVTPVQPSTAEKLFLTKYAELKDFNKAAEEVGRAPSELLAVLSYNKVFRDAVNLLEEELGIARTPEISEFFEWDDAKRNVFLITYANEGDMSKALRSIGVTNIQFHRELQDNPEFRARLEEIEPIARRVFDWAAASAAIRGDSRMLGRTAANFFPEKYGENLKMDLNLTQKMNPEQVNEQIAQILSEFDRAGLLTHRNPVAVDAEFSVVTNERPSEDAGAAEAEEPVAEADANSDLVSDT